MQRSRTFVLGSLAGAAALAAAALGVAAPVGAQSESEIAEFSATGDPETVTVPDGVTCLSIAASGAQGGSGGSFESDIAKEGSPEGVVTQGGSGGLGAGVTTTVEVTPGEELTVIVGVQGEDGLSSSIVGGTEAAPEGGAAGGLGGFADGGDGGDGSRSGGGGGGGKSEVSPADGDPFVVAGGGGGGGGSFLGNGADGGDAGENGAPGDDGTGDETVATGGGGGTQTDPGAAGANGSTPNLQSSPAAAPEGLIAITEPTAGDGSAGGEGGSRGSGGGGGGGGWFGGGGGGAGDLGGAAGGGAGSSFASAEATFEAGVQSGDGSVLLSWVPGDDSCVEGTVVVAEPEPVSPAFTG